MPINKTQGLVQRLHARQLAAGSLAAASGAAA
jgi:hypothetical protein